MVQSHVGSAEGNQRRGNGGYFFESQVRILPHPTELDYRTVFASSVIVEADSGCHTIGDAVRKTSASLGRLVFTLHVYGAADPGTHKGCNLKSLSASQYCIHEEGS